MCGIVGIATTAGARPSLAGEGVALLRDRMAHRGPDGEGLADLGHVILGHRRLAVVDLCPEAAQPFENEAGTCHLVYNGELYNDDELRGELERRGVRFRTSSDAETLLYALEAWGEGALPRLRGMFAFAFFDASRQRLLLARDPLGIKPLYAWVRSRRAGDEIVFASELQALASHPEYVARADTACMSAYLTTIRTTLGARTLFADLSCVRAGELVTVDLAPGAFRVRRGRYWNGVRASGSAVMGVREAVVASVRAHLRADVPVCALLSGGLDSSIVASVASRELDGLRTYCSGAAGGVGVGGGDFEAARVMARERGTIHTEACVTRELFGERWAWMVDRTGVPLSTPNEVAINEVSRRLRADGMIVALSGEGADELFGGYDAPLSAAVAWHAGNAGRGVRELGAGAARLELELAAWIPARAKASVLHDSIWRGVEQDSALKGVYKEEFACAMEEARDDSPLQSHLAFQRRINLAGLLQRLDSATMLEGVEGRTPFADVRLAELANSLPMREKFVDGGGVAGTKIALRVAFAGDLPGMIVARPKASFPLPFQEWMNDHVEVLARSEALRELIVPGVIKGVVENPGGTWRFAWPMINLALWARRWWGR